MKESYKFEVNDVVYLKGHTKETSSFTIKHRKTEIEELEGNDGPIKIVKKLYSYEGIGWFNEKGLEIFK